MPYRQSLWATDVTVAGVHLGLADKWSGGEKTSDSNMYMRAGGNVNLGARATRGDGTATFLVDETLDSQLRALDSGVGQSDAVIVRYALRDDGITPMTGRRYTLTGKLKEVPQPDGDYGSSDGATVDLQFSLDADLA
jgi:hypothetical protein